MKNSESYEEKVKRKIINLGKLMGFEISEQWTPSTLKGASKQEVYLPRLDIVWFKRANSQFIRFLRMFNDQKTLDPYKDIEKEIIVGFELELTDRPTKYISGDVSNLSGLCDYGFIVMKNVENLVKRSIKASRAFSILHGTSNVFVIDPETLDEIIKSVKRVSSG